MGWSNSVKPLYVEPLWKRYNGPRLKFNGFDKAMKDLLDKRKETKMQTPKTETTGYVQGSTTVPVPPSTSIPPGYKLVPDCPSHYCPPPGYRLVPDYPWDWRWVGVPTYPSYPWGPNDWPYTTVTYGSNT